MEKARKNACSAADRCASGLLGMGQAECPIWVFCAFMGMAFYGGRYVIHAALTEPAARPGLPDDWHTVTARDQFSDHWRSWQLSCHEQSA